MLTSQYKEYLDLIKKVKPYLPETPIIIGGPHPSAVPEESLRDGAADIVAIAEGEKIAIDLFKTLDEEGDLKSVPGIAFLDKEGNFIKTSPIGQVSHLDTIPFPPWDVLHPERYRGRIRGRRKANIITSRGCPYSCVHCYRGPTSGPRYRKRSVENILEEIRILHTHYGIGSFRIVDDIFTLDMERARKFCDALSAENYRIFWNCMTRVASVDLDLLKRMKKAGCICVDFGIESGSDYIREKLRKKLSKDQARQVFNYCHEIGMPCMAFFMIGTPWETPQTIEETISFAKELRATITLFFLATPFPGTELREEFIKKGWPVPSDYDAYQHYIEGKRFVAKADSDTDGEIRNYFAAECRRATRETILSQLSNIHYYPQLVSELLRRHSLGELAIQSVQRVRRLF